MEENKINEAVADTYIKAEMNTEEKNLEINLNDSEDLNLSFSVEPVKDDWIHETINDEQSDEVHMNINTEEIGIEGDKEKETEALEEYDFPEEKNISDDTKIYVEGDLSFHIEGFRTSASGKGAHAEGSLTKAIGQSAHAEGSSTRAIGFGSHAEGVETYARENGSHAEGIETKALGDSAHAEGFKTISDGLASHAEGYGTNTMGLECAYIMGKFGDATHPNSWHIANGISDEFKCIGARIQGNGFGAFDLGWSTGNRGYAEMFETLDGEPIEPGYFVTLEGSKIRRANRRDEFILGVTSAGAGIIGNAGELRWRNKYETDEWGRIQYRNILVPPVLNEEGDEIFPEHYEIQPQLNTGWDSSLEYIPRLRRPEWVPVVIKGCALVRDDGSCKVNRYCRCNSRGVAAPASRGNRVLERISENQILILIN